MAVCVLLETFFLQWQWLCWEFLLLLHSFESAYTDKNHSSKITANHSASGNDVEVTVIWAELCGYEPSSLFGKAALGGAQSFRVCFQALRKKGRNYRTWLWVALSHPVMNIYATYYQLFKRHCSVPVVTRCIDNCKTNSIFQLTPFLITSHLH